MAPPRMTADQVIQQYQSAMSVEQAKNQAAKQMIDELTQANIHLRSGTLLLQGQIEQLKLTQLSDKIEIEKLKAAAPQASNAVTHNLTPEPDGSVSFAPSNGDVAANRQAKKSA